jgi:hypothetical protein
MDYVLPLIILFFDLAFENMRCIRNCIGYSVKSFFFHVFHNITVTCKECGMNSRFLPEVRTHLCHQLRSKLTHSFFSQLCAK